MAPFSDAAATNSGFEHGYMAPHISGTSIPNCWQKAVVLGLEMPISLPFSPQNPVSRRASHDFICLIPNFRYDRHLLLAREITKKFESIHRVKLRDAAAWLQEDANNIRGEFVVIVANTSAGAALEGKEAHEQELERTLAILCSELPLKQAVALAVKLTGEKKNRVYDLALALKETAGSRGYNLPNE